jgi:hypothetical protein
MDTALRLYTLAEGDPPFPKMSKMESLLNVLERTYTQPSDKLPRLLMWSSMIELATCYKEEEEWDMAADTLLRALESIGYVIEGGRPEGNYQPPVVKKWGGLMAPLCARAWIMLATCYHHVAPRLARQAREYAKTVYKMHMGEDETFVIWLWPEHPEAWSLPDPLDPESILLDEDE